MIQLDTGTPVSAGLGILLNLILFGVFLGMVWKTHRDYGYRIKKMHEDSSDNLTKINEELKSVNSTVTAIKIELAKVDVRLGHLEKYNR